MLTGNRSTYHATCVIDMVTQRFVACMWVCMVISNLLRFVIDTSVRSLPLQLWNGMITDVY